QSYLLAANGIKHLSPAEAKELGELTSAVYAPLPPPSRKRLDLYMERVRGLQVTQPQEDREMTALVREAVLQFPEPQRTRYQLLYEKAMGVGGELAGPPRRRPRIERVQLAPRVRIAGLDPQRLLE